jgi:hypothetical protein
MPEATGFRSWLALLLIVAASLALAEKAPAGAASRLPPGKDAWQSTGSGVIRGVTISPIEARFTDRGYGSAAYARTLVEVRNMGGTWVSLAFRKVWTFRRRRVTRSKRRTRKIMTVRRAVGQRMPGD